MIWKHFLRRWKSFMQINNDIILNVESDSNELDKIIKDIVDKYAKELDEYMAKIKMVLTNPDDNLTDNELNKIMITLCSYAYFLSTEVETVGVRQDISDAIRSEKYNLAFMQSTGTVEFKKNQAESLVKEEDVVSLIYSRSYKMLKGKMDNTIRMSDAIKKIISNRIKVMELSLISV